jgi:hypothetical protein
MTNTLTIGAAAKPAPKNSPSRDSSAIFASTLVEAKSDPRRTTDRRKKDGVLPPIDQLSAVNNILGEVPDVTHPVRLFAALDGRPSVIYHAQREHGAVTLRSDSAPGDALNGQSYRVTPGPTSTIVVNGARLSTLPPDAQSMHLLALRRARFISEQGRSCHLS